MIVRFTPRAVADIAAIAGYVKMRSPHAALRIEQAVRNGISHLTRHPNLGTERPISVCADSAFLASPTPSIYRIEPDAVVVVHLRDDRRRPLSAGNMY